VLVQAGEQQLAAAGHLLGGSGAEHLLHIFGRAWAIRSTSGWAMATNSSTWRRSSWMAPSTTSGRMAVSARSVIHRIRERRGCRRFERGGGAQVVGLGGFGMDLGERLDQLRRLRCAAAGEQALLDALAISE